MNQNKNMLRSEGLGARGRLLTQVQLLHVFFFIFFLNAYLSKLISNVRRDQILTEGYLSSENDAVVFSLSVA